MAMKNVVIFVINLTIFASAALYDSNLNQNLNMWESLRPGALLHALDQITANVQYIESPMLLAAPLQAPPTTLPRPQPQPSQLPQMQRRISSNDEGNNYSTKDHLNADKSSEFDYDKAYDQFVQQYFNTEKNAALHDEDEDSSRNIESRETPYSTEYEDEHSEPWTAASKKAVKEKCKKVKRNRQECVICKNLRNNEKSEICSYSTETEPEAYAYNQQKSYKKQRNSSNESDEDEDGDEGDEDVVNKEILPAKSKKTKARKTTSKSNPTSKKGRARKVVKSQTNQPKSRDFKKRKDTSSCIKTLHRHKICYDCHNPDGEEFVRCYSKSNGGDGNRSRTEEEVQKSEKKIYKRMVSYSYAKGKDVNDAGGKSSKTTTTT